MRAALFDFDGTLVDTTDLIYQSMRHAAGEVLGREVSREVLMANVGQPLPRQMELLSAEHAGALLDSYRLHNEANHDATANTSPTADAAANFTAGSGLWSCMGRLSGAVLQGVVHHLLGLADLYAPR